MRDLAEKWRKAWWFKLKMDIEGKLLNLHVDKAEGEDEVLATAVS